jgi:indole-3-glycerol phosphate synthase
MPWVRESIFCAFCGHIKKGNSVANILDKIIEDKHIEVAEHKKQTTIEHFKQQIASLPKCRNFYKAITKPNPRGLNVIAEAKKASPSAGLIREDFDPVKIAQIYKDSGADAISCLTDEKYFQGKLEFIQQIKDAVDLPILRKDFIVDPWQIYEARAAGADAILLIADVLNKAEISDMMILASELTLTVLLEVHAADRLLEIRSFAGFPKAGYSVIGINNRNLSTMKVDINTTGRLADLLDEPVELVTESGIKTRADVEKLIKVPVNACLIGQTLCESLDISEKFKELFG